VAPFRSANYPDSTRQVLEQDGERLFRGDWLADVGIKGSTVLTLVPTVAHPEPRVLGRIDREYVLREEPDTARATPPLELRTPTWSHWPGD
jgi:hypothetical protein